MRLSEIKGSAVFDVIADIIPPIASIAEDQATRDLFNSGHKPEDVDDVQWLLARVKRSLPALIKGHKSEIVEIVAAINQVTPDEYCESLTVMRLMGDVMDIIQDDELLGFLSSREQTETALAFA